jgi:molybdopterin converting factor small subunit
MQMRVRLNYYGMLTESTGCREEEIEITDTISASGLLELLTDRYPEFIGIPVALFAENKRIPENRPLRDGVTIDCMPPFSGG